MWFNVKAEYYDEFTIVISNHQFKHSGKWICASVWSRRQRRINLKNGTDWTICWRFLIIVDEEQIWLRIYPENVSKHLRANSCNFGQLESLKASQVKWFYGKRPKSEQWVSRVTVRPHQRSEVTFLEHVIDCWQLHPALVEMRFIDPHASTWKLFCFVFFIEFWSCCAQFKPCKHTKLTNVVEG